MSWQIEVTDEFREWYLALAREQKHDIADVIDLLEADGPLLGAPYVKRIVTSRIHNLKELRCSSDGTLRVLFVFDPRRCAILLLGGDKTGQWEEWYEVNIHKAEILYDQYLAELKEEGLL